jgi:hypothetical protein
MLHHHHRPSNFEVLPGIFPDEDKPPAAYTLGYDSKDEQTTEIAQERCQKYKEPILV